MNNIELKAWREPWMEDTIAIRIGSRVVNEHGEQTGRAIALPLQYWIIKPEDAGKTFDPTVRVTPTEAQQFMDELWRAGIRPTEAAGSVGQLAATIRHLEDMRTLVFNSNPR